MNPSLWVVWAAAAGVIATLAGGVLFLVRVGAILGEGKRELTMNVDGVSKRVTSIESNVAATASHTLRLENVERGLKEIGDSFKAVGSTVANLDKAVAVFIAKSEGNHESLRRDLADLKGFATQRRELRSTDKAFEKLTKG